MALGADTVWEIRDDGSDTNGGGYISADPGTDYSQQAAAVLNRTNISCTGNDVFTDDDAGGLFTDAMIGNIVYLSNGPGWYEIIGRNDGNNIQVDRNGPNDTGMTLNVGGALLSIGGLGAIFQTADHTAVGMHAYVRSGTHNLGNAVVNTSEGPLDLDDSQMDSKAFYLKGYDSAEGRDSFAGTRPVIHCNGNAPANVIEVKGGMQQYHLVAFIEVDGDSQNTSGLYANHSGYNYFYRCIARDCDGTYGIYNGRQVLCYAVSCAGDGFGGGGVAWGCLADTCGVGFDTSGIHCIAYNSVGDGFFGYATNWLNCVSYNSGGDGFDGRRNNQYINCVSWSAGGYSFRIAELFTTLLNCADGDSVSGRDGPTDAFLDVNPVTLTADPFVDAANLDFRLNNLEGGGALLRAAGIDTYGQTSEIDIGAVQHEDTSGLDGADSSLVAHYKFENDYLDASGRGYHGSGDATFSTGHVGTNSGVSDGTKYVSIDGLGTWGEDTATGATVCFWWKSEMDPPPAVGDARIMGVKAAVGNDYFIVNTNRDNAGDIDWRIRDDASNRRAVNTVSGGYLTSDGVWHFIVIVLASTFAACKIYVDGVSVAIEETETWAVTCEPDAFDRPLYLFAYNDGGRDGTLEFEMDDLRFYNDILTQGKVNAIYNSGLGTYRGLADQPVCSPLGQSVVSQE